MSKGTGVVKFFKGTYGFILPDDGGRDIFFHWSNIDMDGYRYLERGERVLFDKIVRYRGPAVKRVVRLKRRRSRKYEC